MDTQTANTVAAAGRAFCFTGRGRKSRSEMAQAVKRRGGGIRIVREDAFWRGV